MLSLVVGDAVDLSWMRKRTIVVVALAAANPIEMLVHKYSRRTWSVASREQDEDGAHPSRFRSSLRAFSPK
jgi:hypothetical protein